jgi:hypothetical protein
VRPLIARPPAVMCQNFVANAIEAQINDTLPDGSLDNNGQVPALEYSYTNLTRHGFRYCVGPRHEGMAPSPFRGATISAGPHLL